MKPTSGQFTLGIIIGLLVGLLIAVVVSFYMNNVPIPFVDKLPQRTDAQDTQEAQRNQNWNPNADLSPPPATSPISERNTQSTTQDHPEPTADPFAILNQNASQSSAPTPPPIASTSALTTAPATAPSINKNEIIGLFIQVGAYARTEDAEQHRAKLAMLGLSARIFERVQNGQILYRVRLGPFENREDTIPSLDRLQAAGIEANLVRVERAKTP